MPNEVIPELSLATRRRLSVELAQRIWPDAEINWTLTGGVCVIPAGTIVEWRSFSPFTSHEDAQALVRWWKVNRPAVDLFRALVPLLYEGDPAIGTAWRQSGVASRMLAFLLATPEQITLAACRALNLNLEDDE